VYLAPDVAKALRQWQGHQAAAAHYVFPSRGTSLTARHIRNLMTGYLKLAGIPTAYSPHALRHNPAYLLMPRNLTHSGGSRAWECIVHHIIRDF
jgi:integrase